MNTENDNDIFQVSVNDTGKVYINKFFKLVRVIFFLIIVEFILSIFLQGLFYFRYTKNGGFQNLFLQFESWAFILSSGINLIGVFYYLKFSRRIKYAVDNLDSAGFNEGFRWIYINGLFFFVTLLINTVQTILVLISYMYR